MKDFNAFLDMRSYKNWAHKITSCEHLSENLSCQFYPKREPHFSTPLNSFQRDVESRQLQQDMI